MGFPRVKFQIRFLIQTQIREDETEEAGESKSACNTLDVVRGGSSTGYDMGNRQLNAFSNMN